MPLSHRAALPNQQRRPFVLKISGDDPMRLVLVVLLLLLLLGAAPIWPYSANWGYYPSGGLGLILLIVLVIALTGRR